MRVSICFFLFFSFFLRTIGQNHDTITPIKPSLSLYGFIRTDAILDTRQVTEAREGYLLLYPKNIMTGKQGEDLNAHGSYNQYAMTARLGIKLKGNDILGAKSMAILEGDFTGASNSENNSFRLRHAYTRFSWQNVTFLAGQYWHPLDVPEMLPEVLSLNTGAPYHSYSRQPQLRADLSKGKWNLVLAISSQRDFVNSGPQGSIPNYLRHSMIPNLHSQIQFKTAGLMAGIGGDYKKLVPRLITDSLVEADESVHSYAAHAFFKLNVKPWVIKSQFIIGQNLNDHLLLGGYGVSSTDRLTDIRKYASINYVSGWINVIYKKKNLQYSIFAGYTQSLGCPVPLSGPVYARDPDIFDSFRIAPMIIWTNKYLDLAWEMEITSASYGVPDLCYNFQETNEVLNIRNTFSISYNF